MKPVFNNVSASGSLISLLILMTLAFSHLSVSADIVSKAKTIKIGCLYPLVGSGALYGEDSVAAIKIAEADIKRYWPNSEFDFKVLIGDPRSKSLRVIQVARSFVEDDKVDFLCGCVINFDSQIPNCTFKLCMSQ
jgi:branched-chain amino acid transport system substrate-binding protein